MLVLIDSASQYVVYGADSQGAHADPCSPLKAPTMAMCAVEESGLINHVFFNIMWTTGFGSLLTWKTPGTSMHYGIKGDLEEAVCGALSNVLVGNFRSCHQCGCYFCM